MELENIKVEFERKYYRWALSDFYREIECGLPFLSSFKGGGQWKVAQIMAKLTLEEKYAFAHGLIKRWNLEAANFFNEPISQIEQAMLDKYLAVTSELNAIELDSIYNRKSADRKKYASRSKIKKLVLYELEESGIELFEEPDINGILTYRTEVSGWDVFTRIFCGERSCQVSYKQSIWSRKKIRRVILPDKKEEMQSVNLKSFISLSAWLGITSSTEWNYLTEGDIVKVAKDIRVLAETFIRAAPELLEGLEV